ncbi:carbohydrate sulfotransferase 5-like [Branchiostoma floridae]|nr:carbohydrate sulfotransferase 5-like [Branchiostoma floridae]
MARRYRLCVRSVLKMALWCSRRGLSAVMAVCCLLYVTTMFSLSGPRHATVNPLVTTSGAGKLQRVNRDAFFLLPPATTLQPLNTSVARKAVLVLSQLRLDAEVVGEIFSQQEDVFYFPEHLWSFLYADPFPNSPGLAETEKRALSSDTEGLFLNETDRERKWATLIVTLRALFRCDFDKIFSRDDSYGELGGGVPPSVAKDMFCREIQKYAPLRQGFSCHGSPAEIVRRMTSLCVAKATVVVMIAGITHVEHFQSLVEDETLNVRVVEAVHDPRAVLVSWMNAVPKRRATDVERRGFFDTRGGLALTATDMTRMCIGMVTNLLYWSRSSPPFRTNYAVLRYEDLRADPRTLAENVLSFLGHRPASAADLQRVVARIERKREDVKDGNGEWRKNLTVAGATKIQGRCSEAIRKFGYKFVKSERDLTDNTTSLVGTFPIELPGVITDRRNHILSSALPRNETILLQKAKVQTVVHYRLQARENGTQ